MTSGNMKARMKYQKPEMRDLYDLTPVAGQCIGGAGDVESCSSGLSIGTGGSAYGDCSLGDSPSGSCGGGISVA